MKTRRLSWLPIAFLSLAGCGDNAAHKAPDAGPEPDAGPAAEQFTGRVLDDAQMPMSGATVSINGASATTAADGSFAVELEPTGRYVINVEHHGYVPLSRIHRGAGLADLELTLTPAQVITIDPTQPVDITDDRGTRIELPANALVDQDGNPATEPIEVHMHTYDLSKEEMVGDMEAVDADGNLAALQSVGVFSADFTDASGNAYQLADGQTAQISMTLPDEITFSGDIPLWYYDMDQGRWIEEGAGVVEGGVASGEVSHFSAWNFDYKIDPGCIRVEVAPDVVTAPGGWVRARVELTSPWTWSRWGYLQAGDNVFYNMQSDTDVKIYIPPTSSAAPYEVNTGAPWGGVGVPPSPYTDCNGYVYIGSADGTISGTVQAGGRSDPSGVTIKVWDGTTEVDSTTADASGAYTLSVPAGTYTVTLEHPGYLDARFDAVSVASGKTETLACIHLVGGDVNDDGSIDSVDEIELQNRLGQSTGADDPYDINGDGRIDSADLDIMRGNAGLSGPLGPSDSASQCLPATESVCDDGADDDGDGDIDCDDADCAGDPVCSEICDNGIDDTGDGLVDCQDPDCTYNTSCPETCFNGIDDDSDGYTDCLDAACTGAGNCPVERCDNGTDDDSDGDTDCADADCTGHQLCP